MNWIGFAGFALSVVVAVATWVRHRDAVARQRFATWSAFREKCIQYASEFSDVLSDAILFSMKIEKLDEAKFEMEKAFIMQRLSSHLEKGRFLFPNVQKDTGHGLEKRYVNAGFRSDELDRVYAAYLAVSCVEREFGADEFSNIDPRLGNDLGDVNCACGWLSQRSVQSLASILQRRDVTVRDIFFEARRDLISDVDETIESDEWLSNVFEIVGRPEKAVRTWGGGYFGWS